MSEIVISIKPKWCDLIFSGEKIHEIRRTRPKELDSGPMTVYVYMTGGMGVIGKFTLRETIFIQAWKDLWGQNHLGNVFGLKPCMSEEALFNYLYVDGKKICGGWAWHVEDPVMFDRKMKLDSFGLKRPPQSWCYINK